jgi:hypothetical protein
MSSSINNNNAIATLPYQSKDTVYINTNFRASDTTGNYTKIDAIASLAMTDETDNLSIYFADEEASYQATTSSYWLIDSGASRHFSYERSDFISIKRWSEPKRVKVANGSYCAAEGYGDIRLDLPQGPLVLLGAWFVPSFRCKLISPLALNGDGIAILLKDGKAEAMKLGKQVFKAENQGGQYALETVNQHQHQPEASYTADQDVDKPKDSEAKEDSWSLAHRRLGHLNYRYLDQLKGISIGLELQGSHQTTTKSTQICEPCLAGKMRNQYNKSTDVREHRKIRRLHADISGVMVPSIRNYRYFLLVIDDATRVGWIRLLTNKSTAEIFPHLQEIKTTVEKETGEKVVYWRCDNGRGEFGSTFINWLAKEGIQHEPSPPNEHWLNGVVERAMQEVNKIARTLIFEAKLPQSMWCYATEHAVWLRNRRPTDALPFGPIEDSSAGKEKTPYAAYTDRLPNLTNVRVFGCKAAIKYPPALYPQKHQPMIRQEEGIWVGMKGNHLALILDRLSHQIRTSTVVKTDETKFPSIIHTTVDENLPPKGIKRKAVRIAKAVQKQLHQAADEQASSMQERGTQSTAPEQTAPALGSTYPIEAVQNKGRGTQSTAPEQTAPALGSTYPIEATKQRAWNSKYRSRANCSGPRKHISY